MRKQGVPGEEQRDRGEAGLGPQEQAAAVEGVGDRASDDGDDEQRDERAEAQQADVERRVREVEELDRDGDERDLAADERDRLSGPEAPERRRLAQRRDVDRRSSQ